MRTERLDDNLAPGSAPSFIKIDVEGAAVFVVRGALETIKRFQPVVVLEWGWGATPWTGTTADDMFDLLTTQIGYRIFDLTGAGPYDRDTLRTTSNFNFVVHA